MNISSPSFEESKQSLREQRINELESFYQSSASNNQKKAFSIFLHITRAHLEIDLLTCLLK